MSAEVRKQVQHNLNCEAAAVTEEALREKYGQLWNTQQMQEDYTVLGFMAPFIGVIRKSDGVKGSLMFSHMPRWYHTFEAAQ